MTWECKGMCIREHSHFITRRKTNEWKIGINCLVCKICKIVMKLVQGLNRCNCCGNLLSRSPKGGKISVTHKEQYIPGNENLIRKQYQQKYFQEHKEKWGEYYRDYYINKIKPKRILARLTKQKVTKEIELEVYN